MRRLAIVLALCLGATAVVCAQGAEELTRRLQTQTGLVRAQTLAALTDALRQDSPSEALKHGGEALSLFAAHPDPANQVRTLNEMAWAHLTLNDYASAVSFAERGRALAEQHGDARGRARAINNLGVIANRRGDALQAVDFLSEALKYYRMAGADVEISTVLSSLGFVYSRALADDEAGLAHHVEALGIRERLGDKSAIAISLNSIGTIYYRAGESDRALSYFERALALRRGFGDDSRSSDTLANMGDVHHDRKDYRRALDVHTESLELRRKIGDAARIASSLTNLGIAHSELENTDAARRHLNEALSIASAAGAAAVGADAHLGLARLDRDAGSPQHAIAHARQALAIAERGESLEVTRQAWEQLAASQEAAGDLAGALASFRKFQQVNDRIFSDERSRRVELLERRYQAEQRESQIAELKAEQAAAALQLSGEQSQRTAIIAGVALFGLLGAGLYRRRVESARIAERLSVTDSLTGLKNRRYVLQTIDADASASVRKHRTAAAAGSAAPPDGDLVFVLIDIDHFKAVNDQFGHAAGDSVIMQIADVLRSSCRASDTIARWGGEEFLVIFRFTNRETAAMSVERIRMAVEQHVFHIGADRTLRRTCSIGFAPYPLIPERPDRVTWEQVISLADEALYSAKQSGRNAWAGTDPALHGAG